MRTLLLVLIYLSVISCNENTNKVPGYTGINHNLNIVDSLHIDSGLKDDPNLPVILANCTACHSAKLIIQNRASREGWKNMITWMQETQKLWDLGGNEEIILDYLEKNYSPDARNLRRANLDNIEWYSLD